MNILEINLHRTYVIVTRGISKYNKTRQKNTSFSKRAKAQLEGSDALTSKHLI